MLLGRRRIVDGFLAAVPSTVAYSRTGPATGVTANLALANFAANAAPITDRGMLVEAAGENLFTHSDDFTQTSVWGSTGTRVGGQSAPDGSTNGVQITMPNAATTLLRVMTNGGRAAGISGRFFVKSSANVLWSFLVRNATTSTNLSVRNVNFTTNPSGTSAGWTVVPYPNGWWEVSFVQTMGMSDNDTMIIYYGNSGENFNGSVIQVWGADFFQSPTLSSHVPTTAATATRGLPAITRTVPPGRTVARAIYGTANTVAEITGLTPGASFDLVTGRPWVGLGNELKTIEWR